VGWQRWWTNSTFITLWNNNRLIKPNSKPVPNPKITTHVWLNRGMLADTSHFEAIQIHAAFWIIEFGDYLCRSPFLNLLFPQRSRSLVVPQSIVRVISISGFQDHSSNLFKNLNILKLNDIYKLQTAVFMYRAKNNLLPASCSYHVFLHRDDCLYDLRNKPDFVSFRYRTNIRKRFIGISGPIVWKSLPNTIKTRTSISQLVRNLTQFLMRD